MSRAVCPGSYDPVTNGHLDIIERAAVLFDEVIVAVGVNATKRRLFSADERIAMLKAATKHLPGVRVSSFSGLVTDFCAEREAQAIVKGLRSSSDFDYELPMAHMNTKLTGVETVFLPTSTGQSFISSSLVKEVAGLGGDVSAFLPPAVHRRLLERLGKPG